MIERSIFYIPTLLAHQSARWLHGAAYAKHVCTRTQQMQKLKASTKNENITYIYILYIVHIISIKPYRYTQVHREWRASRRICLRRAP